MRFELTAAAVAAALACAAADRPWLSAEERARIARDEYGIEFQAGAPETDATRFYTNPQKTEWEDVNYDETKAGVLGKDYTLEDPLVFADGRRVKSAADWAERRKEILDLFEREVYGRLPPKPEEMVFDIVSEEMSADRFALIRTYRQFFRKDRTGPSIDWLVILPRHANGKAPVFLHMNYRGNDVVRQGLTNHFKFPWEQLVARGYAVMSARYENVTSDPRDLEARKKSTFDGVYALWGARDPKRTDLTGTLMAWAWGFMRGLDLAEQIPEIDAKRNVVIGSSRIGKAALLAGAYDERFKVVIPNQTGAAGVQLLKRDYGESARTQYWGFPHWYCEGYWKWREDPKRQPFDQHLLLACVAPRNLLLEGYHKKWFDPKGEFLAAQAAAPVWAFLGGRTFDAPRPPAAYDETYMNPPFGFVTRTECHGLSPYDWKWAMDFADRVYGTASGTPGCEIREDKNGDRIALVTGRCGSFEVKLRGAQVVSCGFAGDAHRLFYIPRAGYARKIRPGNISHGGMVFDCPPLAGVSDCAFFAVKSAGSDDEKSTLVLEAGGTEVAYVMRDHSFTVEARGPGARGIRPYFAVSSADGVKIASDGRAVTVADPAWRRTIRIESDGMGPLERVIPPGEEDGPEALNLHPTEIKLLCALAPKGAALGSFTAKISCKADAAEEIATPKPGVPELLKFNDGTPVKTVADWAKRRAELKAILQREEYGFRPVERPENLKFELVGEPKTMMGGLAVRKIVRASWTGPFRNWSFEFLVFEPVAAAKPAPSFILICNRDRSNIDPERKERSGFWPAEEIIARGYAAITFHYEDIAPDNRKAPFSKGVYSCWAKDGARGADTWGALSAWAWGASRVLDWIETEPALNAKRVAVVGHSRGGKTALLAGALDERFAMACANDSGCSGVKLNRFSTLGSEPIAAIARSFPHWFSPAYPKWAERDAETPFDQHELVALMAPRLCAVADATWDDWAGQLGEWYSCSLASPVWTLFGKKGLEPSARPPVVSGAPIAGTCLQDGSISYHCRPGGHNLTLVDWNRYMDFADHHGWRD